MRTAPQLLQQLNQAIIKPVLTGKFGKDAVSCSSMLCRSHSGWPYLVRQHSQEMCEVCSLQGPKSPPATPGHVEPPLAILAKQLPKQTKVLGTKVLKKGSVKSCLLHPSLPGAPVICRPAVLYCPLKPRPSRSYMQAGDGSGRELVGGHKGKGWQGHSLGFRV